MRTNAAKLIVLLILIAFIGVVGANIVAAVNCWDYDGTSQTECEAADVDGDSTANDCRWDSWGDWCYEKGCWDYWDNATCTAASAQGCFWQTDSGMGWETGWCQEEAACWNYWTEGSANTAGTCLNVSGCLWKDSKCNGPPGCENINNETGCYNSYLGCWWDFGEYCYRPGCWDFWDETNCEAATGLSCDWKANSYCTEQGGNCWNYNTQTTCEDADCNWESYGDAASDGWCYKPSCWDFNTNNATCVAALGGSKCVWDEWGEYCYEKSCWNYYNEGNCTDNPNNIESGCEWMTYGYCSEPNCYWDFEGNESGCNASVGCYWDTTYDECYWEGCWQYSNETSCNATSGCYWKQPQCRGDADCSAYVTYDTCYASSYSCWWDYGDYCTELSCWDDTFSTNQTTCENDSTTYGLACQWDTYWDECWEKWCGSYTTEESCNGSVRGDCYWDGDWCYEESCWGYNDNASCLEKGCSWDSDWGYCQQDSSTSCYDLNSTECVNATFADRCKWDSWGSGWCSERGCWDFTTNATCSDANLSITCEWVQDTGGWCEDAGENCWDQYMEGNCTALNCTWDSTWNSCYEKGCWDYWSNATCTAASGCEWATSSSSGWDWGWCEKRACWNYDNTDGDTCVNNTYNLSCAWDATSAGWCWGPWQNNCWEHDAWNGGDEAACNADNESSENCTWQAMTGWCYEEMKEFNDFSSEGECLKSGWGFWNATSAECQANIADMQNPGCWIFDGQPEECNAVRGCNYTTATATCDGADEIHCLNITSYVVNNQTNQTLCEAIPMLSTCCKYQAGICNISYDTACWDQMADPPAGADHCLDYNAIGSATICNQIAGDPWYMPCKWDNTTAQCQFKEDMATNMDDIKTKKNCEFLGGTWKTESVCGTTDCPEMKSWCEMGTGNSLYGCDASCWACNSSTTCRASNKGYCVWKVDASLLLGGWCDIPDEIAREGDCDNFCPSCEHYSGGDYTPEAACQSSKASCKWDNATDSCIDKSSGGCSDDCFYCYDKEKCNMDGGGAQGTCKWDSYAGMCTPANFDGEICFDEEDNDNDGLNNCDDPSCMFEPVCGGGTMGECWRYADNASCVDNGCSWFQDPWTMSYRCDMNGSNCWIYEENAAGCTADANCVWFNDNFCEINHTKADACFQKTTQTGCEAVNGSYCIWNVDAYSPQGGWCDFAPFQCSWNSTLQRSKSDCENNNSFCTWVTDAWSGTGWCEPKCFARNANGSSVYTTLAGCQGAISGGLCEWGTGWCQPNNTAVGAVSGSDCAAYDDNQTLCGEQPGCAWFVQMIMDQDMGPGMGGFFGPQCGVKMATNVSCWDFKNQSYCNTSYKNGTFTGDGTDGNACIWVSEGSWAWCEPLGMHCGPMYAPFNQTTNQPQVDINACNADTYCYAKNDSYMDNLAICVPVCNNATAILNETTCGAIAGGDLCVWMGQSDESAMAGGGGGPEGMQSGGWCDPVGSHAVFNTMEGGKPYEIATDACSESGLTNWTDACFLGIKEMGEDYAFSVGLAGMTYAAVCNDETLWDGTTGSGRKTTKGFWYLDTDGSETGNCRSDDGNATGFEFKLIAKWSWSDNGLEQSLAVKRCSNSSWIAFNTRVETHPKKMCRELQGMIITVNKADLLQTPDLFSPEYPMRIYAVTAGENNTATSPADKIGPGYYMSGKVDFKMEDCKAIGNVDVDNDGFYAYEDPDCKHLYLGEDKGFSTIEDCYTLQDDDMNGLTNCDDDACKNEVICGGVLAPNATDREAPDIRDSEEHEHLISADIEYTTDERSNGTVLFYGVDSSCTLLNDTIRDKGLWNENNTNYTKYKFKHTAELDNRTHTDNLDYGLDNNTVYYYKMKVCDISGNCALSGCMNFTTRSAAETKMVRFDDPDTSESWKIDTNGTGAFIDQGHRCALTSNNSANLGDVVDPETTPEIDIQQNQTTSGGDTVSVSIGGIDTAASQAIDNLDMDIGTVTGSESGATEDYVWINDSAWAGDSGVFTTGAPDNVTIVMPGSDTELWDCQNIVNGIATNCTNITGYATRSYSSANDETTWIIPDPTADLWSYIIPQTPSAAAAGTSSSAGGSGGGAAGTATSNDTNDTAEEEEDEEAAPITGGAVSDIVADKEGGFSLADVDLGGSLTYIIAVIAIIVIVALLYFYKGGSGGSGKARGARPTTTYSSRRGTLEGYGFRVRRR